MLRRDFCKFGMLPLLRFDLKNEWRAQMKDIEINDLKKSIEETFLQFLRTIQFLPNIEIFDPTSEPHNEIEDNTNCSYLLVDADYAIASSGSKRKPERHLDGNIIIPTYEIVATVSSCNNPLKRTKIRTAQVLQWSLYKKILDDVWQVLLAHAAERDMVVFDKNAKTGVLSKRLLKLMNRVMYDNSNNVSTCTSFFILSESEDMEKGIYKRNISDMFYEVNDRYHKYIEEELSVSPVTSYNKENWVLGVDEANYCWKLVIPKNHQLTVDVVENDGKLLITGKMKIGCVANNDKAVLLGCY